MARILVVGLNPAWQHVWEFPAWKPGEVNRAVSGWQGASGKGLNAALALRALGHEVALLQCLAGETGRRCEAACADAGILSVAATVPGETRTCATLLHGSGDSGARLPNEVTELIAPFGLDREAAEAAEAFLLDAARRWERDFRPEGFLISGTLPPGMDPGLYRQLAEGCSAAVKIGDTVQGWGAGLGRFLHGVKVNRDEWRTLQSGPRGEAIAWPAWRFITDGSRGAVCERAVPFGEEGSGERKTTAWKNPALPAGAEIVNPIGAGDTASAGWMHAWLGGEGPAEAVAYALALATASCLRREPARFDPAVVEGLRSRMRPPGGST